VAVYRQWAEASSTFAWVAFFELFLFTAILVVGLAWVWAHGDLEWVKDLTGTAPRSERAASSEDERRAA
jgi:NADH-quinone oxidoreductase subunit A